MSAGRTGVEQVHKDMADELRRAARQASAAAGSFIRWSIYLETDPAAAIAKMRTVLITSPDAKNPNPLLPQYAAAVLEKIDPASIERCRKRRDRPAPLYSKAGQRQAKQMLSSYEALNPDDREKVHHVIRVLAGANEPAKPVKIKHQDSNVVSVEFGGAS